MKSVSLLIEKYCHVKGSYTRPKMAEELCLDFNQGLAENAQTRASEARAAGDDKLRRKWNYIAAECFSIVHHTPLKKPNDMHEYDAILYMVQSLRAFKSELSVDLGHVNTAIDAGHGDRKTLAKMAREIGRSIAAVNTALTLGESTLAAGESK